MISNEKFKRSNYNSLELSDNSSEDSDNKSEPLIESKKYKIKRINIKNEIVELKEYIATLENKIFNEIDQIKNKLQLINTAKQDIKIIPLKRQVFTESDISSEKLAKLLISKDINSIIKLIKMIYTPSTEYTIPIKYCIAKDNKKTMYYYSEDNKWELDEENFIINTLCDNIQKIFMRVNNLDIFANDDDFMKNQDFILRICDNKYKINIMKKIKEAFLFQN